MDEFSRKLSKERDDFLWCFIRESGGLHRDRERWDSHMSVQENRRQFRFLDRADGKGIYLDRMAQELEDMFPEYDIHDGNDLWAWLQSSRIRGGDVLCERLGYDWAAA